jgi:hypothetical protein
MECNQAIAGIKLKGQGDVMAYCYRQEFLEEYLKEIGKELR